MNSSATRIPISTLCTSLTKTLDCNGDRRVLEIRPVGVFEKSPVWRFGSFKRGIISMRDRSKNRKPLQRGRNLSIEAIQTVQALKRAKRDDNSLGQLFDSKFKRLLKKDMVFEDIQKEYWYKPQVLLYADMITVLASNGLFEQVELLYRYLKLECTAEPDIEGFNDLLRTLVSTNITGLAMDCFYLMKALGCEPDKSSFRILINGLESKGEMGLSAILRQEAQKYYGESLEFLEEKEEMTVTL